MNPHEQLLNEIKEHLEESEVYAAYSANVARHYRKRDLVSKWVVAAAACGPFIDKLATASQQMSSWTLALMPLLAIGLPLLNYSTKIELASSLHGHYVTIIPQLRNLWRHLCSTASPGDEQLTAWQNDIYDLETKLAEIRRLKQEMPVIRSLGEKAVAIAKKYTIPSFITADETTVIENEEQDAFIPYELHAGEVAPRSGHSLP
ncbi:MAG: hypothetical protein D3917_11025 [Candidatus Electrothrix sp. AX5]|nr:hypothetical protein [Candidatus Electrothrix sp. AX5]